MYIYICMCMYIYIYIYVCVCVLWRSEGQRYTTGPSKYASWVYFDMAYKV